MQKIIFNFLVFSVLSLSLNAQKTYTDLRPMVKIFTTQRIDGTVQPVFSINVFNDQRFEYTGYNGDFLIGAYSTYLNKKDYKSLQKIFKKIDQGRFIYTNPKEMDYSIQYIPLVKSVHSTQASLRLLQTPQTIQLEVQLNQIFKNSKWIKQDVAPSPFGENVPDEVVVTMEKGINIPEWIKKYNAYKLHVVASIDTFTHTYTLGFDANKVIMKDMVARLDEDNLNVVGVLPNRFLNAASNKAFYAQQELIIELATPSTNPEALLEAYAKYDLKFVKRIAPNLNYYTYTFDSEKIDASMMLEKLRANPLVKAAQINKEITGRRSE